MWAWYSNFWDKNYPFLSSYTFKLAGNNWIEGGPGPVVFNIVVSYCCKRKMLKTNWNLRNNRRFWWNFNWGVGPPAPPPPPLGNAYVLSEENKKGVRKFYARFLAFSNEISTVQKIVLSSSRGQANFRGLEASRPRTWPLRPRPRTSKCVLEDVLEAKDVLQDFTSDNQ